jgi:hydroxyacylglutathione hydrolase
MASPDVPARATDAEGVADAYFAAIGARDVEAAVALWAPGGVDRVAGIGAFRAPEGVRELLHTLLDPFPDVTVEVLGRTVQGDRAAIRWTASGTFAGKPFQGVEATGAGVTIQGIDVLEVRDGAIVGNDAVVDVLSVARAIGLVPQPGTAAERRLTPLFNARTRLRRRLHGSGPEQVADGVWVVRGGFPARTMNVFLVRETDPAFAGQGPGGTGVLVFDGGIRAMTSAVALAGAQLGGITRVVLGHAHPDHRGIAPALGVPVLCHPDERADAEGDGGWHDFDFSLLDVQGRLLMPRLLRSWDGGPVPIAGTVREGDEVAGFRVVDLPGHAPGQIGLWREVDRVALVSDCFYTLDPQTGRKGGPRVPHAAFNHDTEQARASIRKLAAMEPFAAWPGHADPLKGEVRAQLETAAATT